MRQYSVVRSIESFVDGMLIFDSYERAAKAEWVYWGDDSRLCPIVA
jgi:hypothetical protein